MFQADISVARKLNKLLKERVLFVVVVGVVFFLGCSEIDFASYLFEQNSKNQVIAIYTS